MASSAGSSKHSKDTSLFVGNLPPKVTEAQLLQKFSQAGAVCSVVICRDKATKRFLGYGYVSFRRAEDATLALKTMNGRVICGRPVHVVWARGNAVQPEKVVEQKKAQQQVLPDSSSTNDLLDNPIGIFITGLNAAIREKDLQEIFSSSGSIVECGVGLDDAGNSKGFGFVQYENEEAVENCLEKVKSWMLMGSTLTVTKLYTNIHVYNFGWRLNFSSFRELFEPYGTIVDYRVVKHFGKSQGFGYVTFRKLKSAAHAIGELQEKDLGDGIKLKLEPARRPTSDGDGPPNHEEGVKLYVKIMEASATNERLQELFSPFGPIISAKVFTGSKEPVQRAGFVQFAFTEDATRAIFEMNGKVVGDGPLSVSLAHPKKAKSAAVQPSKPKNEKPASKKKSPTVKDNPVPEQQTLTAEQKRALSDRLYLVVKQLNASMAGSITGKLLELDNLQRLMTQPAALKAKVDETVVALLLNREQHLQQIEKTPAGSAAA